MQIEKKQAGRALTKAELKTISGGKAAYYYTYWKCTAPGWPNIQVCHWTDPAETFCAPEGSQCTYTNRACMYAECY